MNERRRPRRRGRQQHGRHSRHEATQKADTTDSSLWQTFRAVVLSPRQAMADLAIDPRAGRKGIQLLVIVEVALAIVVVVQSQAGRSFAAVWWGPVFMAVLVAAGAAVLWVASRGGSYASAFGRLSFAFEVPTAVVGLPMAVATAILLLLVGSFDEEPLALLSLVVSLATFAWALVLVILAVRASVAGRAAVGCTAMLIIVAFIVVTFVSLGILIATGVVAPLAE